MGGKTTETKEIDPDLKAAALEQLAMAKMIGQLGFVPYKGDTVAGFQPAQRAAMQNTNSGLSAFGLDTSAVPSGENLSPYGIYQEQLAAMDPGQREFIESMFINPITGAAPKMMRGRDGQAVAGSGAANSARIINGGGGRYGDGSTTYGNAGGAPGTRSFDTVGSYMPGGVNTANPNSLGNRIAAAISNGIANGTITAADRPVSRSTGSYYSGGSGGGGSAGSSSSGGSGGYSGGGRNPEMR